MTPTDTKIPTFTDRDRRLVAMWLAGKPLVAIRDEFGLKSHSSLVQRAKRLGLPPKRSHSSANLFPEIVRCAKLGFTPLEIARGIGCSKPELVASIGATHGWSVPHETKEQYRARARKIADRIVRERGAGLSLCAQTEEA